MPSDDGQPYAVPAGELAPEQNSPLTFHGEPLLRPASWYNCGYATGSNFASVTHPKDALSNHQVQDHMMLEDMPKTIVPIHGHQNTSAAATLEGVFIQDCQWGDYLSDWSQHQHDYDPTAITSEHGPAHPDSASFCAREHTDVTEGAGSTGTRNCQDHEQQDAEPVASISQAPSSSSHPLGGVGVPNRTGSKSEDLSQAMGSQVVGGPSRKGNGVRSAYDRERWRRRRAKHHGKINEAARARKATKRTEANKKLLTELSVKIPQARNLLSTLKTEGSGGGHSEGRASARNANGWLSQMQDWERELNKWKTAFEKEVCDPEDFKAFDPENFRLISDQSFAQLGAVTIIVSKDTKSGWKVLKRSLEDIETLAQTLVSPLRRARRPGGAGEPQNSRHTQSSNC
jgi:hypothetical protein